MVKLIGFGLAAGAGVQAWRNFPPDGPVTARSLALAFVVGVVCAYLGGRWHGRHHVSAWASAKATANAAAVAGASADAHQTVNVAVFAPPAGSQGVQAGGRPAMRFPDEETLWVGSAQRQISSDELDGMDLSEFAEDTQCESTGQPIDRDTG